MSNLAGFIEESTVDGQGVRNSIFLSGCTHNCKGCQNKEAQDFNYGIPLTLTKINELISKTIENDLVEGITITGGDPLHPINVQATLQIMRLYYERARINEVPYSVWIYTGYTIEELLKRIDEGETMLTSILEHIDMLVDGRFVEELKSPNINFAGSTNQRLLDSYQIFKYLKGASNKCQ